ncbi:MAG: PD40 domain-containing protein [Candidatus Aenigmarchaeota archaeon]|nr:PD40 domain-containing protein [Candidatus Aenigmarchaeota archaeon]
MKSLVAYFIILVFTAACVNQTTSETTMLASGEIDTALEWNGHPSFSPNGEKIVFQAGDFAKPDLYIMDIQTGNIQALLGDDAEKTMPSFSPDGKRIIFSSEGNIAIINSDGSHLRMLANTTDDFDPVFSPDGTKILFSSFRGNSGQLWIMDVDGNNQKQITNVSYASEGVFSSDGAKIAFVIGRNIPDSIYTSAEIAWMYADGTGLQVLTDQTVQSHAPEFTPDGKSIVYGAVLETGLSRKVVIRMITLDETKHLQLKEKYNVLNGPTFSHDGKKFAYTSLQPPYPLIIRNAEDLVWEPVS